MKAWNERNFEIFHEKLQPNQQRRPSLIDQFPQIKPRVSFVELENIPLQKQSYKETRWDHLVGRQGKDENPRDEKTQPK